MNIMEEFAKLKKLVGKSFLKERKIEHHFILFDQVMEINLGNHENLQYLQFQKPPCSSIFQAETLQPLCWMGRLLYKLFLFTTSFYKIRRAKIGKKLFIKR